MKKNMTFEEELLDVRAEVVRLLDVAIPDPMKSHRFPYSDTEYLFHTRHFSERIHGKSKLVWKPELIWKLDKLYDEQLLFPYYYWGSNASVVKRDYLRRKNDIKHILHPRNRELLIRVCADQVINDTDYDSFTKLLKCKLKKIHDTAMKILNFCIMFSILEVDRNNIRMTNVYNAIPKEKTELGHNIFAETEGLTTNVIYLLEWDAKTGSLRRRKGWAEEWHWNTTEHRAPRIQSSDFIEDMYSDSEYLADRTSNSDDVEDTDLVRFASAIRYLYGKKYTKTKSGNVEDADLVRFVQAVRKSKYTQDDDEYGDETERVNDTPYDNGVHVDRKYDLSSDQLFPRMDEEKAYRRECSNIVEQLEIEIKILFEEIYISFKKLPKPSSVI